MVVIHYALNTLLFSELIRVYEESNYKNAESLYDRMDRNAALLLVEQDFYSFLSEVFFKTKDAFYAVLEENGRYYSAVRVEPFQNGVLLSGLETARAYRGLGYGKRLVKDVLSGLRVPVYSHVDKNNTVSLKLHASCGFRVIMDNALYLDGSWIDTAYTLCSMPDLGEKDIDK